MRTLTFEQMEQVNGGGGWGCAGGILGMAGAFLGLAGATVITGGAAAGFMIGYLVSGVTIGVECGELFEGE